MGSSAIISTNPTGIIPASGSLVLDSMKVSSIPTSTAGSSTFSIVSSIYFFGCFLIGWFLYDGCCNFVSLDSSDSFLNVDVNVSSAVSSTVSSTT